MAARAIVKLLGLNPNRYPSSYSWARFQHALAHGRLHRKLVHNPGLARQVALLEKIASQPVGVMISRYTGGGSTRAIYKITTQLMCRAARSDPGSVPTINTYFLYQAGYCESRSKILAHRATFERQVSAMTRAIGRRPVLLLLEMDAIGSSSCMARNGALRDWEADIRYEIGKTAALPHAVVYIEGGYSDAESPGYTARVLRAVGVGRIRGFYTNDTHINWTINEIRWGEKVSRLAGGAHFVVNTSDGGRGPLLNPHPATQGVEDLCNPPGRGAGPPPTTNTGFPRVDAFIWVHIPGESSGYCNGGTASGTFWLARTLTEAANANARLGPALPSLPF
jgi:endoglucanase